MLLVGPPGAFEIILIVIIVLLLFGGRKIPELMRGLGQGMKEFKKATGEDDSPGESVEEPKTNLEQPKASNSEKK